MSLFMLGKTHLPHRKKTAAMAAVRIPAPQIVRIPMAQHIGTPATPVVKAGDTVYVGTLIGAAEAFVCAPVHSSVSGTVKKIEGYLTSSGKEGVVVVIESDGLMTPDPSIKAPEITSFADISAAARNSGLIGLGGAGFPTSVKLDPKKIGSIDTLVLNGAECEPYITSDTRTMLDDADNMRYGIELMLRHSEIKKVAIGIENNKPECIKHLKKVFSDMPEVKIVPLPSRYPQGAEKVLVHNTVRRVIPEGKLPADVGVIVMNVTTIAALAKYIKTGMPLVEKCITVDGGAIAEPKNIIVPVGMSVADAIEAAGGYKCEVGKILFGGPMMGVAIYDDTNPIMKNCNAIVALSREQAEPKDEYPCIHCGRCVEYCPMNLNPTLFARALNVDDAAERAERLEGASINLCIECGCCSYVCPSARPLVENHRLAKAELREYKLSLASKEK